MSGATLSRPEADAHAVARELDSRARREALDVRRSMLLQAPAGSGKTTVLTARFLALLAVVDAPEEILAITFTRKAAAEMRHRILEALQAASAGQAVPGIDAQLLQRARARDEARGWQLLRNPARLRVETIDALNHWLASQLPIAARSGPSLAIAPTAAPLYRRAARRALEQAWREDAYAPAAALLFERLDNSWGRLEQLLAQMLERRSHWLPHVLDARGADLAARVEQSIESVLRAKLAAALVRFPPALLREAEQLLAHARTVLATGASMALSAEASSLPQWRALCELALTEAGWRRRFTLSEGFERNDRAMKQRVADFIEALEALPGAAAALGELRLLPDARLAPDDTAALEALALLLVRAAAELQLVFATSGKVDYAYVAAAARAALSEQGEPSDFALRAGGALRHLLIDEFQDTSYEQLELLRSLSAGWEPGDGRTLFVVGDPMQSIYQFREAEVGLFLRARDRGVGDIAFEALTLRRNFRSQAPLIEWINARFARLFPPEDDARLAAVRYLSCEPATPGAGADGAVTLHRFDTGDFAAEANCVVQIARAARATHPAATIAVLVAGREHAAEIVVQLRAANFTLRGINLEPLRERAVIRDLSALTRALLHPADRTAWLALLRAPWCALTLAELEALLAGAEGDLFAWLQRAVPPGQELSDESFAPMCTRLSHLCAALEPALQGKERGLPLWQRVEHSWLRLAGPAIYPGEIDRLDARCYLDALAVHEEPDTLVGEALAELTAPLFSAAPPQPQAIEVMTMHAAKGLEWDVVILPGLGRRTAVDSDPLLHWLELPRASEGSDLLLAPIRATQREPRASLSAYIKHLRRQRTRLERVRLLYVAATRARSALHLLAALPTAPAGARPAPQRGSLLEVLWPAIGEDWPTPAYTTGARNMPLAPAATRVQPALQRLPAHWRIPEPPSAPPMQRLQLAAPSLSEAPEYSWVGLTARAVGTVVHAELRRLALAAVDSIQAAAPASPMPDAGAPPNYEAWLAELGVEATARPGARARILEALRRTLEDSNGRWLLSGAHRAAGSEWRLTGMHEGRLVNVVVDRMLVDEHGQRWVVDFKTSTHAGGAVDAFIDSEAQRYRAQLQRYAALASQLGPEPVRVALYFPLLGVFRELALD